MSLIPHFEVDYHDVVKARNLLRLSGDASETAYFQLGSKPDLNFRIACSLLGLPSGSIDQLLFDNDVVIAVFKDICRVETLQIVHIPVTQRARQFVKKVRRSL